MADNKGSFCFICEKQFANAYNLKDHTTAIHEGIRFQCKSCDKSFSQESNLRRHIKTTCGKPVKVKPQSYRCNICNSSFPNNES